MVGKPSTINWQAPAELFWQAERTPKRKRKRSARHRRILTATLAECVRHIVARPPSLRPRYFIKVSAKWGVALKRLDYLDAQALAWRIDFPDT